MPENTVKVARPTIYGNPFKIGATVHFGPAFSGRDELVRDAADACRHYRRWLFNLRSAEHIVAPLRGKNLACFCPLDQPCHADVLLELANPATTALLPADRRDAHAHPVAEEAQHRVG